MKTSTTATGALTGCSKDPRKADNQSMENAEDLAMIEARLGQDESNDMSLDEFAALLGVDLTQVRAEVASSIPQAKYERN